MTSSEVHVVHLTAEYWPYARTGGLGEAVRGLANYQASRGVPTSVVLPLYRVARNPAWTLEPAGAPYTVAVGTRVERARLWRVPGGDCGVAVHFIAHEGFFDRDGIYGEEGADYPDNARRYAFFVLAALHALPAMATDRIVLHAHDWHTALGPVYLKTVLVGQEFYDRVATVLSVHNAGYQGHFPRETLAEIGLPDDLFDWQHMEWYGRVNWLKGGLVFSDVSVTVSRSHAAELRTPDGGFGLHETFIGLGDRFVGIVNGIDTESWNAATDPHLVANFDRDRLEGKARCKTALQAAYALPERPETPVIAMTARLVEQKGFDLILGAPALLRYDAQYIFLGAGEPRYREALSALAAAAPQRVGVEFNFSEHLEHQLLAGADMLLMPSLYEPCGLTQMRAQRYGAVPIVRRVGGLADTVEDGVTGVVFDAYAPQALEAAVGRALALYGSRATWRRLVRRAMQVDWGWERSGRAYAELYQRALRAHGAA
jgi:starch synthase